MGKIIVPPAAIALAAALLFGASTPAAKLLIGQCQPQMLAGLLYLGSGTGLFILSRILKATGRSKKEASLKQSDSPWLAGAILFGGIGGPLLLMIGLTSVEAGQASLLLNMEAVLTALLAWFAFKENFDRRIFLGMVAIVIGSLILSWHQGTGANFSLGSLAIIGGCLCWALDNNFTRNISDADPLQIASIKGFVAGVVNTAIALFAGATFPALTTSAQAAVVGFLGYGVSLVLFILSLRHLGTARTGAYFSTAPFAGAIISILALHEPVTINFAIATLFMAIGVWLHLSEKHEHKHTHMAAEHEHIHSHDEHHQHEHAAGVVVSEPHSHWHKHVVLTHSHAHFPDANHRHEHD